MAAPTEVYEYGVNNSSLVDEPSSSPVILVDTLTISFTRNEELFQNVNGSTTRARYTDPTATFDFAGKIRTESGLATQHPGTLTSSLANFQDPINGFDPDAGIILFKDPSRELDRTTDFIGYSWQNLHLPFVEVA